MSNTIDLSLKKDKNFNSITANKINTGSFTVQESVILTGADLILTGGEIDIDVSGGNLDMLALGGNMVLGAIGAGGAGGDIFFTAREGGGSGGDVFLTAIDAGAGGGNIIFESVDVSGSGGNFIANCLDSAPATAGSGANFTIEGLTTTANEGVNLFLNATNGQSHLLFNSTSAAAPNPPTIVLNFGTSESNS